VLQALFTLAVFSASVLQALFGKNQNACSLINSNTVCYNFSASVASEKCMFFSFFFTGVFSHWNKLLIPVNIDNLDIIKGNDI